MPLGSGLYEERHRNNCITMHNPVVHLVPASYLRGFNAAT